MSKPLKTYHAQGLPGLDTSPRARKDPERWVVNYTKKPLGQGLGHGAVIVKCEECGSNGVLKKRADGIKIWEHAREFWVDGTYEARSRPTQYCREKL